MGRILRDDAGSGRCEKVTWTFAPRSLQSLCLADLLAYPTRATSQTS
jgi:hypothetical protein